MVAMEATTVAAAAGGSLDAMNWSIGSDEAEDVLSVREEAEEPQVVKRQSSERMQLRCVCVCAVRWRRRWPRLTDTDVAVLCHVYMTACATHLRIACGCAQLQEEAWTASDRRVSPKDSERPDEQAVELARPYEAGGARSRADPRQEHLDCHHHGRHGQQRGRSEGAAADREHPRG